MIFYRCASCSREYVFRRSKCPKCGSKDFSAVEITSATALDSVHLIATPEPFPDEYDVVLFQTESGSRGFCRATSQIKRGDKLKIRTDEVGILCEHE